MINLRFHIVSIVAVFLALALGIFTGSTLLDRATVDYLKASRDRVDERNDELGTQRDQLTDQLEADGEQMNEFDTEAMQTLLTGQLRSQKVLLIASVGSDAATAQALEALYLDAGAESLGTIWIDDRLDLTDDGVVAEVAASLELEGSGSPAATRADIVAALASSLSTAARDESDVPAGSAETAIGSGEAEAFASAVRGGYWKSLAGSGLLDWELPDGSSAATTLPDFGVRTVIVSSASPELSNSTLLYPLISEIVEDEAPIVVGEIMGPKSPVEMAYSDEERGAFVDPIREDENLADAVITIDNLDRPFGRLAAAMALSGTTTFGAFGDAESATRSFPVIVPEEG